MTLDNPTPESRRDDLLCDRALYGLSPQEEAELAALAGDNDDSLERAAATVDVALWRLRRTAPLPQGLAKRLTQDVEHFFAAPRLEPKPTADPPASTPDAVLPFHARGPSPLFAWGGWLAAAVATIALAMLGPRTPRQPEPPPVAAAQTLSDQMAALVATSTTAELAATEHPLAGSSHGQLVWNGERQAGFLKLEGLAPVDPKKGVYQLWIFDKKRDERYPVDGGVFTVEAGKKATILSIHAAVPVSEPTLFAITLEPPGGVVVSDRQRILLTAAWGDR